MNSLKNNAGYRLGGTNSTKKTSIYTRENTTTGPDVYRQTGSMLLESPRETAQLKRMTSEELAPIELPSPRKLLINYLITNITQLILTLHYLGGFHQVYIL